MNSNAGSVVPNRKKVMGVLIVGVLMGALDISIVGPALPSIERTLWMDASRLSWVFSVYVLASLAGIPLMDRLSDVFGRRSVYTWSVALFGLGSLMVSITDHYNFLLTGRAIQGFG
ncbi:MAG: MFS transporter, partial [Bacteroidales bacterium]|nr:MFS transporter [Bacteroidales bacterium]